LCPVPSELIFSIPSMNTSSPITNGDVLNPAVGVIKVHVNSVPSEESTLSIVNPLSLNIDLIKTPVSGSPYGFATISTPVRLVLNTGFKNPVSSFLPVTLSTITKLGAVK